MIKITFVRKLAQFIYFCKFVYCTMEEKEFDTVTDNANGSEDQLDLSGESSDLETSPSMTMDYR